MGTKSGTAAEVAVTFQGKRRENVAPNAREKNQRRTTANRLRTGGKDVIMKRSIMKE
jgi:hypothetical protein